MFLCTADENTLKIDGYKTVKIKLKYAFVVKFISLNPLAS